MRNGKSEQASQYCGRCLKNGSCPAQQVLSTDWPFKVYANVKGLGFSSEWVDYPIIKAVADCPFVCKGLEEAIKNEFVEQGENADRRYFVSCFGGERFFCHQEEKPDREEIEKKEQAEEIEFQSRVQQKLSLISQAKKGHQSIPTIPKKPGDKFYSFKELSDWVKASRDMEAESGLNAAHISRILAEIQNEADRNFWGRTDRYVIFSYSNWERCQFYNDIDGEFRTWEAEPFESNLELFMNAAEGPIVYAKVLRIAFDPTTPDIVAKQFTEALSQARSAADEAGQPITVFAKFAVKADGTLTFECPAEHQPIQYVWEVKKVIRETYNVVSYNGKYVSQMYNEDQVRDLLRRVRAGNFEGCRIRK